MGELVTGIGDEVILFAALVGTSILIIILWSKVRRVQRRAPEAAAATTPPPSQTDSGNGSPAPPPSRERYGHELRNRFQPQEARPMEAEIPPTAAEQSFDIRLIIQNESISARVKPNDTLDVIRRTYFQIELSQNRRVIFIRQGHILDDASKSLRDWGLGSNSVLHVHVGSPQQGAERRAGEEDPLDLSMLFIPLFGVILGLTWAAFFYWPQYFSLLTKVFLTVLSLAYVLLTYVNIWA